MPSREERWFFVFCSFTVTKLVSKSHQRLVRRQFVLRIRIGGRGTRSPVKSPQNRLRKLLLSKLVHPLLPSHPSTSPPALSFTHTHTHMQMHAWTQTAGCAVLPGTLRERRRVCRANLSPTPPDVHFPLPAATIASSIGWPSENRAQRQPASQGPAKSVHTTLRQGDRRQIPTSKGLAYGAPGARPCRPHLRDVLD